MKANATKAGWLQGITIFADDTQPRVKGSVLVHCARNRADGPGDRVEAFYLHPEDVEILKREAPKGFTPA